jgi:hypothetical protein
LKQKDIEAAFDRVATRDAMHPMLSYRGLARSSLKVARN